MDYEEKILIKLVENYRKSKKDSDENVITRRTKIKPEQIYAKYHDNNGSFEEIETLNAVVNHLQKIGFILVETESFGTEIKAIYLVDNKVEQIEAYLTENYNYVSKNDKLSLLGDIIARYDNSSSICSAECEKLKALRQSRKIPKNIDDLDDILKALSFIENNNQMLYIREVSMKVYGDSKYFEENTIDNVCVLLKKYNRQEHIYNGISDEVLTKYNIYREPQKISIKGNVIISICGIDIDIGCFKNGIEFSSEDIKKIVKIDIHNSRFMTIENRTSYLRYDDKDTTILYLGGFANRDQRDFLKMVYKCNPDITYLHFGDIDAGGFWIHHELCSITDIKFGLFGMSINELADPIYKSCLRTLTDNDIRRLKNLLNVEEYHDVIEYMLAKKVKLEQEIVSLNLMNKH